MPVQIRLVRLQLRPSAEGSEQVAHQPVEHFVDLPLASIIDQHLEHSTSTAQLPARSYPIRVPNDATQGLAARYWPTLSTGAHPSSNRDQSRRPSDALDLSRPAGRLDVDRRRDLSTVDRRTHRQERHVAALLRSRPVDHRRRGQGHHLRLPELLRVRATHRSVLRASAADRSHRPTHRNQRASNARVRTNERVPNGSVPKERAVPRPLVLSHVPMPVAVLRRAVRSHRSDRHLQSIEFDGRVVRRAHLQPLLLLQHAPIQRDTLRASFNVDTQPVRSCRRHTVELLARTHHRQTGQRSLPADRHRQSTQSAGVRGAQRAPIERRPPTSDSARSGEQPFDRRSNLQRIDDENRLDVASQSRATDRRPVARRLAAGPANQQPTGAGAQHERPTQRVQRHERQRPATGRQSVLPGEPVSEQGRVLCDHGARLFVSGLNDFRMQSRVVVFFRA